jgi:hypothetical protein
MTKGPTASRLRLTHIDFQVCCIAGFQTCCIADFQGRASENAEGNGIRNIRRFRNLRYSRFGNLRYESEGSHHKQLTWGGRAWPPSECREKIDNATA